MIESRNDLFTLAASVTNMYASQIHNQFSLGMDLSLSDFRYASKEVVNCFEDLLPESMMVRQFDVHLINEPRQRVFLRVGCTSSCPENVMSNNLG